MNQNRGQRFLLELPAVQNDLPFPPDLLPRLFRLTDEGGDSPLAAIATAISADQGLSTRMLALANSAFYGLQAQVTNVARAVAVLGLREIRALILALGMSGLAARRPLPRDFALGPYLEHQVAVAQVAQELARLSGAMDPDDAFTAGVLHDLGKLVTALYHPEDWQAQADLAAAGHLPWHEAETRHFGLDHGLIGAMVLRSWNLPDSLTEPVNWHHAPQSAPEPRAPGAILNCADACVRLLTHDPAPGIDLEASSLAILGLTGLTALEGARTALDARDPALFTAALT
ncbi:MAG: HDOD domain-containing protein [Desulfovibrionaceae bacterium]